jgi:hypothetical protein
MKGLLKFGVVVLVGYFAWNYLFQQGTGDRPPVFVMNGPVRVEAQFDARGRGEFKKGMWGWGNSWYHHHPAHSPSSFEVIVTESSCGAEARYTASELRILSSGSGASSSFNIKAGGVGPLGFLEVEPDTGTTVTPDPRQPYRIDIGSRDDQLTNVRVAGSSCAFVAGQGSIAIYQKH